MQTQAAIWTPQGPAAACEQALLPPNQRCTCCGCRPPQPEEGRREGIPPLLRREVRERRRLGCCCRPLRWRTSSRVTPASSGSRPTPPLADDGMGSRGLASKSHNQPRPSDQDMPSLCTIYLDYRYREPEKTLSTVASVSVRVKGRFQVTNHSDKRDIFPKFPNEPCDNVKSVNLCGIATQIVWKSR